MTVTVNQVLHLPWLGFFERAAKSDVFVLYDTIQFLKQDFFNRNRLKTPQGAQWLTVPVRHPYEVPQTQVYIDNTKDWARRNWRQIETNYNKAPYFQAYEESFQKLYKGPWEKLVDLNTACIIYIAEQMGIRATFVKASELPINHEAEKSQRLADMCKVLGAHTYYSGQGGHRYLREEPFVKEGIRVTYQDFRHPVYPQLYGDFIPELSVIDLLFNKGPESLAVVLGANTP